MAAEPFRSNSSFRFQVHSGDARRGVRMLAVSRPMARILVLAAAFVVLPAACGLLLAPWWLYSSLTHRNYRMQLARRTQQGERLQALSVAAVELGERLRVVESELAKVRFLYGLAQPAAAATESPAAEEPASDSIYAGVACEGAQRIQQVAQRGARVETLLAAIEAAERAQPDLASWTPAASPLRGLESVLISGFGSRRNPYTRQIDFHSGLDLAAPRGTAVRAPAAAVVAWSGVFDHRESSWWRLGRTVVLRHGDRILTLFGHLDEIRARAGARVAAGEVIGTVGNSGWTTTVHLHYEIRRRSLDGRWVAVDPRYHILDRRWEDEERLLQQPDEKAITVGEELPRWLIR